MANYDVNRRLNDPDIELPYNFNKDVLTGLYNKNWLHKTIDSLIESNTDFSVLFLDLNGLKRINDTKGHAMGDKLIIKTGGMLEKSVREHDAIGYNAVHVSGDEFAVIMPGQVSIDGLSSIIKRIRDNMADIKDDEVCPNGIDIAIGGAIYEKHETTEEVLARADSNMMKDKKRRKEEKLDELSRKQRIILKFAHYLIEKATGEPTDDRL